jgi:hypothetical protein
MEPFVLATSVSKLRMSINTFLFALLMICKLTCKLDVIRNGGRKYVTFLSGARDVDETLQMMKRSVTIALGVLKVKAIEAVKASMHWIV